MWIIGQHSYFDRSSYILDGIIVWDQYKNDHIIEQYPNYVFSTYNTSLSLLEKFN